MYDLLIQRGIPKCTTLYTWYILWAHITENMYNSVSLNILWAHITENIIWTMVSMHQLYLTGNPNCIRHHDCLLSGILACSGILQKACYLICYRWKIWLHFFTASFRIFCITKCVCSLIWYKLPSQFYQAMLEFIILHFSNQNFHNYFKNLTSIDILL